MKINKINAYPANSKKILSLAVAKIKCLITKLFDYLNVSLPLFEIVSVLLVLFTLFEMRAERIQAYRPCMVMDNVRSGVVFHVADDFKLGYITRGTTGDENPETNGQTIMTLSNIGLGIAKDVSVNLYYEQKINNSVFDSFCKKYSLDNLSKPSVLLDEAFALGYEYSDNRKKSWLFQVRGG